MAAVKTASEVLTGTDVKVWCDGEELGTFTNFEATVTYNYEDIQIGFDVDRVVISSQGDGSISHQATNSISVKLFNKLKANRNLRFKIEGEITKVATGEVQSMTLNGCTFDSLPLAAWGKGEVVTNEMSFRFMPSQSIMNQIID